MTLGSQLKLSCVAHTMPSAAALSLTSLAVTYRRSKPNTLLSNLMVPRMGVLLSRLMSKATTKFASPPTHHLPPGSAPAPTSGYTWTLLLGTQGLTLNMTGHMLRRWRPRSGISTKSWTTFAVSNSTNASASRTSATSVKTRTPRRCGTASSRSLPS